MIKLFNDCLVSAEKYSDLSCSVRTSELRSEYFSALTKQSVNKCLLLLFRLISKNSHVLSKPLITSGMYKTPKRDRGRHLNRNEMISGNAVL